MVKPIKERKPKKHYAVLLHGEHYAETWAVSPQKAISNVWWKFEKNEDEFTLANYSVEDFDAVEI
jgi:hypothetical protein